MSRGRSPERPFGFVAAKMFIEAMGYWEKFMMDNNLFSADDLLPQKIIPADAAS